LFKIHQSGLLRAFFDYILPNLSAIAWLFLQNLTHLIQEYIIKSPVNENLNKLLKVNTCGPGKQLLAQT